MKPAKKLRLSAEPLADLAADDLRDVVGAFSGFNPCTWPGNSVRTCWSVCELTCNIC